MAIKTELTQWEFTNEFMKVRPDNFSLRGLEALYQYFYEVSEEMGEDIEFDPIAILSYGVIFCFKIDFLIRIS